MKKELKKALADYELLLQDPKSAYRLSSDIRALDWAKNAQFCLCSYMARTFGTHIGQKVNLRSVIDFNGAASYMADIPIDSDYAPHCFEKRILLIKRILIAVEHPDGIKRRSKKVKEAFGNESIELINQRIKNSLNEAATR